MTAMLVLPCVWAATADDHEQLFRLGQKNYADQNYTEATLLFEQAVTLAPDLSNYHHWLGKSYGRQAEEANLFKAYELSKKTRAELEQAVELDDRNIEALADLMEFYRQAPAFLGGGQDKADNICKRLKELKGQNPETPPASPDNPDDQC